MWCHFMHHIERQRKESKKKKLKLWHTPMHYYYYFSMEVICFSIEMRKMLNLISLSYRPKYVLIWFMSRANLFLG